MDEKAAYITLLARAEAARDHIQEADFFIEAAISTAHVVGNFKLTPATTYDEMHKESSAIADRIKPLQDISADLDAIAARIMDLMTEYKRRAEAAQPP